jgi:DNA polymerase-3 subunit delta
MLSGDVARLVRMLEGLKGEGEALPLVLWAVAEEIRTLLRIKSGLVQGKPYRYCSKKTGSGARANVWLSPL